MSDAGDFHDLDIKKAVNQEVGRRIFKTRTEKKMSREDLAKRSNITVAFLRLVENGDKGLSSNTIRNIVRALNISSDYLLFGTEGERNKVRYVTQAISNMTEAEIKCAEDIMDRISSMLRYPDEFSDEGI